MTRDELTAGKRGGGEFSKQKRSLLKFLKDPILDCWDSFSLTLYKTLSLCGPIGLSAYMYDLTWLALNVSSHHPSWTVSPKEVLLLARIFLPKCNGRREILGVVHPADSWSTKPWIQINRGRRMEHTASAGRRTGDPRMYKLNTQSAASRSCLYSQIAVQSSLPPHLIQVWNRLPPKSILHFGLLRWILWRRPLTSQGSRWITNDVEMKNGRARKYLRSALASVFFPFWSSLAPSFAVVPISFCLLTDLCLICGSTGKSMDGFLSPWFFPARFPMLFEIIMGKYKVPIVSDYLH